MCLLKLPVSKHSYLCGGKSADQDVKEKMYKFHHTLNPRHELPLGFVV